MSKLPHFRFSVLIGILVFFLTVFSGIMLFKNFYLNIFRLSSTQISELLSESPSECTSLAACTLIPGDVLLRRYITQRTELIDRIGYPYFTHSAFYLGDDQIVEAVGTEKDTHDDIQVAHLSRSDWFDPGIEGFVIMRPHYENEEQLANIQSGLEDIANDPEYKFGLPGGGGKRTTCADLIVTQLIDQGLFPAQNMTQVITPDYLFSLLKNTNSKIVGYKID